MRTRFLADARTALERVQLLLPGSVQAGPDSSTLVAGNENVGGWTRAEHLRRQ